MLQPGLFDVSYIAHPGFVDIEELQAIQGPLSIAAAGKLFYADYSSATNH